MYKSPHTASENPDMINPSLGQYELVHNAFSFAIATMGAATAFFWFGRSQVSNHYKTALTITGLVTAIALYHYIRIFDSWEAAFTVVDSTLRTSSKPFNDAYRYVDWLLTVPLLLIELILVMRLSEEETWSKGARLGLLAALMVALGYPGEISQVNGTRWLWWTLAMVPFIIIVRELYVGLGRSIASQPPSVRGLVKAARDLTVVSWCFYPIVFVLPMLGLTGGTATTAVQVGYTIADVAAKAVFGVLIFMIAVRKSDAESDGVIPARATTKVLSA
jgi:bacteriorhodopsin